MIRVPLKKKSDRLQWCGFSLFAVWLLTIAVAHAEPEIPLSTGQTLYVPAYSHIYSGDREQPFLLTVTLAVRNTDFHAPITVTGVEYYDSKGLLLKKYLDTAMALGPLESTRYVVPQSEKSGGSGANFIVRWRSEKAVNPPIVESIMIGTQSQQGISFTSRGQPILKRVPSTMIQGDH